MELKILNEGPRHFLFLIQMERNELQNKARNQSKNSFEESSLKPKNEVEKERKEDLDAASKDTLHRNLACRTI